MLVFGQISDNFNDGDFTSNPTWSGTDADFIVNGAQQLQLNNSIASSSYLSTPHGLSTIENKEWSLKVRQSFSPSGSNFGRVYLVSTASDLSTDPDGFYLQMGESGSGDAIRLFKVVSGVHTEILTGTAGLISSSFNLGIRVTRDNSGNWTVFADPSGGTNYVQEGTTNDATVIVGTHFGLYQEYTVSNADNFFYDDIYVGDVIPDLDPPVLVSATFANVTQVDVQFDEVLDQTSAELVSNYSIDQGVTVSSATIDAGDPTLVHLAVSTLSNGQVYTLTTNNIEDLSNNVSGIQDTTFGYFISEVPAQGDVIINEFMCDPTPVVGLPEVEFVEIYNRSSKIFNVDGWKLGDASSNGTVQQGWLLPGAYMVLTATANIDSFNLTTAVTSFPSLNNGGDNLVLRSDAGLVIDSITYDDSWYQDPSKEDGGYTLERVNPNDPCSDFTNWMASNHSSGGTPGAQNSVYDDTPDISFPQIDQLIALSPNYLELYFTEGMDSTSLKNATFTFAPSLTVQNNYVLETYPSKMTLEFVENLVASQVYEIEIQNAADCWLNATDLIGQFALPDVPALGDLVINEILSNPVTGGYDWIEIYNNSNKLIDLMNWEMAHFSNDTISNNKTIAEHFLLYPNEYVVVCEDSMQILQHYAAAVPGRYIQMDLPSYGNDEGVVYLIHQNQIMDYVHYSADWHFELLDDEDGKSLERIDPNGESNNEHNWHTAAESIGFGTPGGANSQYYPAIVNGEFNYTSETISPDSDGFEDVLQVNYTLTASGNVGTFKVYDDRGRLIATVIDSELLGTTGSFVWKGTKDDGTKASIGVYVGVFEAFDIDGGVVFTQRKAFTVAGKL